MENICDSCGSNKIIENVKITDFGESHMKHNLAIHLQKTNRMFFNSYVKGEFLAKICCYCGKVDLKISNTKELWEAHLNNKT